MVTESEKKKGYHAPVLVHRWTCQDPKCNFKFYAEINNNSDLDKAKLTIIEGKVTEHVLNTKHEVIHHEQEPFRISRV